MWKQSLSVIALALGATMPLGAVEPGTAEFQSAPGVDFSGYSSYAWLPQTPGAGKSVEVRNPAAHKLIQAAVEKELDAKGVASTRGTPDLYIAYEVHREGGGKNLAPSGYSVPLHFEQKNDPSSTLAGTLVVNVFDARTRALVWRGWASEVFTRAEMLDFSTVEKKIDGVVAAVMTNFNR